MKSRLENLYSGKKITNNGFFTLVYRKLYFPFDRETRGGGRGVFVLIELRLVTTNVISSPLPLYSGVRICCFERDDSSMFLIHFVRVWEEVLTYSDGWIQS